jgi:malate dehydrogenase
MGYALLPLIAAGSMFGPSQPVELQLIEIPQKMKALASVVMELDDCVFPLLKSIAMTDDPSVGFEAANWVVLGGGVPRQDGMERKDLLAVNGKIFASQGEAIMAQAAADVRTLAVANPCNTNCLIAMSHAKDVPADR